MKSAELFRRLRIALSVEKLCAEKHLDNVSVTDICTLANVSRTAFYRLFHSKYDVAGWIVSVIRQQGIEQVGRTMDIASGVTLSLRSLSYFRTLYLESVDKGGLVTQGRLAQRNYGAVLRETVAHYHGVEIDKELDFMIEWYNVMGFEYSKLWTLGACETVSAYHAASVFTDCCPSRLCEILNSPVMSPEEGDNRLQLETLLSFAADFAW